MHVNRQFSLSALLLVLFLLPGYSQQRQRSETEGRIRGKDSSGSTVRGEHSRKADPQVRKSDVQTRDSDRGAREDFLQRGQSLRQIRPAPLIGDPQRIAAKGEQARIFESIQDGMRGGNIGVLSQHFGSQVLCNLRDGESGYYSANQAFYLLENYFSTRRLVGFDFSTMSESDSNPYATGSVTFNIKGRREVAQVYVSLSRAGDRWVISQINIY